MSSQRQSTEEGSVAIQSGGDTTIYSGISPKDMKQIMEALAGLMPHFQQVARQVADDRVAELERKIMERFSGGGDTRADAFKDPDFQYLVTRAYYSFARTGEQITADTLVELIARRSLAERRSRLSLSLNEAIEKTALLTENEFAELSLAYMLRYVAFPKIDNFDVLRAHFQKFIFPLLPDISRHETSYSYLIAQACASLNQFGPHFYEGLKTNYSGLLSKGFNREDLVSHSDEMFASKMESSGLIIRCLVDPTRLQLSALNKAVYDGLISQHGISKTTAESVFGMSLGTCFSEEEFIVHFGGEEIRLLFDLWSSTPLRSLTLTSVGLALAHANMKRISHFDAELSIWIQ